MWIKRLLNSMIGIRKTSEFEHDLKHITIKKIIVLFLFLNITFIGIIFFITRIILINE